MGRLGRWLGLLALAASACRDGSPRHEAPGDAAPLDASSTRDSSGPDARDAPEASLDAGAASADASGIDGGSPSAAAAILSLNLHCFVAEPSDYPSVEARLDAVAARAVSEGIEVLLLQEVCEREGQSALDTLRERLELASGDTWAAEWVFAHDAWVGTPDEAREGVAVLARSVAAPVPHVFAAQSALTRLVLQATVETSVGAMRVGSLHLDHADAPVRRRQAQEAGVWGVVDGVGATIDRAVVGTLLAGDLNDREGGSAHSALLSLGYLDATAALSADRIDHVLLHRASALRVVEARELFASRGERVSDHPAVLIRVAPGPAAPAAITTVVVRADVGFGHFVAIRGDRAPLSWEAGISLVSDAPSGWRFATTELAGPFELKVLLDDVRWQLGGNSMGEAGGSIELIPAFE